MTNENIDRLRRSEQKFVTFNCSNGELLRAKILHVDDDHRDVIFDLVSTNKPETYKHPGAYIIHWDDIVDFREDQD
jgi:hypothetical protein